MMKMMKFLKNLNEKFETILTAIPVHFLDFRFLFFSTIEDVTTSSFIIIHRVIHLVHAHTPKTHPQYSSTGSMLLE